MVAVPGDEDGTAELLSSKLVVILLIVIFQVSMGVLARNGREGAFTNSNLLLLQLPLVVIRISILLDQRLQSICH